MAQADAEIERLYGLPLSEFVSARNELAKTLRKAGDSEAADAVKALDKPSVSAWAVNQLARTAPDDVAALLAAGERLRDAQEGVLTGDPPERLREASAAERAAVSKLVKAGERILAAAGHAATEGTRTRIAETLRAAAVDEEGRDLLASGRMTRDLDATGFGPLPVSLPLRSSKAKRGGAALDDRRRERAETLVREHQAEVSELTASLRDAERRAEDARNAAETAARAVERERAQLEQGKTRLARAEDQLAALT